MPDSLEQFTPSEAAVLLGVQPSTLRGYVLRGELAEPGWMRVGKKRQRSYGRQWIDDARKVLEGHQ